MAEVLTNEQIKEKAEKLKQEYGCEIHPIAFMLNETDQVVGFMKEPPRIVKLRVLDKSLTSPMTAAGECLESVLLEKESDPRILSEKPEHDKIFLGACVEATRIIEFCANTFKKK